jgi:hypothetical protein
MSKLRQVEHIRGHYPRILFRLDMGLVYQLIEGVLYVCFVDRCLSFLVHFLLAIVLFVLLRYTDSDCLLGILTLFCNFGLFGFVKTIYVYMV